MRDFAFGPIDLMAAAFDGDQPDPRVLDELADLVTAGHVRVIDILIARRTADGELEFADLDLSDPTYAAFAEVEVIAQGLIAHEDAAALLDDLAPSSSATVVALELTWATKLASRLADSGGVVLDMVRVPAPVVNAVMDAVSAP